ncbi:hypothetical protein GCM10020331_078500 [Ectobacillus funiculus]
MKLAYSLRFKLSTFYLIIIVIPVLIISIIMPYYYQYLISKETEKLTESTLASLSNNINTYLDDLSRITIIPYLNENIMFALQQVASNQYETAEPYTQLMVNRALYESLPKIFTIYKGRHSFYDHYNTKRFVLCPFAKQWNRGC